MRRHRAAIGYELSAADTLPGPVLSTGTGGALLRPVTPHRRPLRIVDAATAELFAELRAPGIVAAETSSPNHLARLVLDGVLEVETDLGWTSGPAAHPLYFAASREIPSHGPIARLSLEGIAYAAALRLRDAATIADRLYRWNTLPDTPAWRRRVPTPAAVATFLDVDRAMPRAGFTEAPALRSVWREWFHQHNDESSPDATVYKLYLSPLPAAVPTLLQRLLPALSSLSDLLGIKLPRQRTALLRPDKVLLYFRTRAALDDAVPILRPVVDGLPAHGVPFTAALDDSGLLGWGADPPETTPGEDISWRSWLCHGLANALALAEVAGDCPVPAWRFARDRLTLDDVNVETWSPESGDWSTRAPGAGVRTESVHGAH